MEFDKVEIEQMKILEEVILMVIDNVDKLQIDGLFISVENVLNLFEKVIKDFEIWIFLEDGNGFGRIFFFFVFILVQFFFIQLIYFLIGQ